MPFFRYYSEFRYLGFRYSSRYLYNGLLLFQVDAKVQSVRFMKNRSGRNSGEAVVTFTSQKDVDAALTRNRAYMGARYVIINQTRDNRY